MYSSLAMFNRFLSLISFGWSKTHAVTIGGWTPGIRCLAEGRLLSCGCLAGVYHTLSNEVAAIIDSPAGGCPYRHEQHAILWRRGHHKVDAQTDLFHIPQQVSGLVESGPAQARPAFNSRWLLRNFSRDSNLSGKHH